MAPALDHALLAAAAAAVLAAAAAGCGLGPGRTSEGTATLTVTRDYGSYRMVEASESDPPSSETVIRFLDREARITTRYGGGFVQSINGLAGTESGGRRLDWFFYVNGIESPVGSADVRVHGGDRIWWDYRDWTNALRVPAVVGSFPAPFAQASAEDPGQQTAVQCAGAKRPCAAVANRLHEADVEAGVERFDGGRAAADDAPRILVGPWEVVRDDSAAGQIEAGPATSGVFADFDAIGRREWSLLALNDQAASARRLGPDAGLVAAVRDADRPPTWVVTGGRQAGVESAAGIFDDEDLRDHYAVAVEGGRTLPLPANGTKARGG